MNFIKNMIVGNRQDPNNVNVEEVAALIDDAESEDQSQAEAFNKLALIQSRIKGTQSDVSESDDFNEDDEFETEELDAADQIPDFADVVAEIKQPEEATSPAVPQGDAQASEPGQDTNLTPIMTEDDFTQLDEELARMSDELEEKNAADDREHSEPIVVAEPMESSVSKSEPIEETEMNSMPSSNNSAKVFEAVKEAQTKARRESASFVVSEQQGGGPAQARAPAAQSDTLPVESAPEPSIEQPRPADPVQASHPPMPVEPAPEMQKEGMPQPEPKTENVSAHVEPNVEQVVPENPTVVAPIVEVPKPAAGRSGRRAGRVKTRLLGFEHANDKNSDPFAKDKETVSGNQVDFPVGWMVVVSGPGYGSAFAIFNGVSQIGRGDDQAIKLDYGDNSISRENHAAVAYDREQNKFFLGHGGKANLVRLNDNPVLSTEEIKNSDIVRIGETTLRFVALCDDEFNWNADGKEDPSDAAIA